MQRRKHSEESSFPPDTCMAHRSRHSCSKPWPGARAPPLAGRSLWRAVGGITRQAGKRQHLAGFPGPSTCRTHMQTTAVVARLSGLRGRGAAVGVGRSEAVGRSMAAGEIRGDQSDIRQSEIPFPWIYGPRIAHSLEASAGVAADSFAVGSSAYTGTLSGASWVLVAHGADMAGEATVVARLGAAVGRGSAEWTMSRQTGESAPTQRGLQHLSTLCSQMFTHPLAPSAGPEGQFLAK